MNSSQIQRPLIDESLPVDLADELAPLVVATIRGLGWSGLENGALLRQAVNAGFTVSVTADQSLEYQQNLKMFDIAVLVLCGRNRLEDLRRLVPAIRSALPLLTPGSAMRLGA